MIPRLMNAGAEHRFWQDWPTQATNSPTAILNRSLFNAPAQYRQLVILADQDALDVLASENPAKGHLLSHLLEKPQVTRYLYADDGLPSSIAPDEVTPTGISLHHEWVVPCRDGAEDNLTSVVFSRSVGAFGVAGVGGGNVLEVARRDVASGCYSDISAHAAAELRVRSTEALMVADAIESDVFITARPYLFEHGRRFSKTTTPMSVEDAIAFIALYLRHQAIYPIDGGTDSYALEMNRGMFYWIGTRELLPASWRWLSACCQQSRGVSVNHDRKRQREMVENGSTAVG